MYLGMSFCCLLGILSDCNVELQAINTTLKQEVGDLCEKLNRPQYQQTASEAELHKIASENEQIKADAENCKGKTPD